MAFFLSLSLLSLSLSLSSFFRSEKQNILKIKRNKTHSLLFELLLLYLSRDESRSWKSLVVNREFVFKGNKERREEGEKVFVRVHMKRRKVSRSWDYMGCLLVLAFWKDTRYRLVHLLMISDKYI